MLKMYSEVEGLILNFIGNQALFKRLYNESACWKLLRAETSSFILAFLETLFAKKREVPMGDARAFLELEIKSMQQQGLWESETTAGSYINTWIKNGWLRSFNDQLSMTSASDEALRAAKNLNQKNTTSTASHLRIVQDAVRDLTIELNPDVSARIEALHHKKEAIQKEIDLLAIGYTEALTEVQQRERIREVYSLASVLTGDFRKVEDDIRQMTRELKQQTILNDATKGSVLEEQLNREEALSATDSGSAFNGFYALICDVNRTTEFREQIKTLLATPAAEFLSQDQQRYMKNLTHELAQESKRIFEIRDKANKNIKAYIASGKRSQTKAIDDVLGELQKYALAFHEHTISVKTELNLAINAGHVKVNSPATMKLKEPVMHSPDTDFIEVMSNQSLDAAMLSHITLVDAKSIAQKIFKVLSQHGAMTLAKITEHVPILHGLEEFAAFMRIAYAVQGTKLEGTELITVNQEGMPSLKVTAPVYRLSSFNFPQDLNSLEL